MGFFSSAPTWRATPGSGDLANQFKDWGESQTLDPAARLAKGAIKQWGNGNYDSGLVGNLLAPIRDQYSTMQRESNRAYGMGAMGLAGGQQPALMARLKQLNEDKIGEQMGHAYAQAVPGLYSSLSNTLQSGIQNRRQAELFGMYGQMGALGMGTWQQQPGILDNLMKLGQFGGQIAGMAMGIPGLGGGGGGLPKISGTGTPSFYSILGSAPR